MENNYPSKMNPVQELKTGLERINLDLIQEVISYDSKFKYNLTDIINNKICRIYIDIINNEVNELDDLIQLYDLINND